jgi:hypothetical protein
MHRHVVYTYQWTFLKGMALLAPGCFSLYVAEWLAQMGSFHGFDGVTGKWNLKKCRFVSEWRISQGLSK